MQKQPNNVKSGMTPNKMQRRPEGTKPSKPVPVKKPMPIKRGK